MKIPSFLKRKFWSSADEVTGLLPTLFKSVGLGGKKDKDYFDYNENSLYVNRALDKRAEKVSEIKFVLKNLKGEVVEDSYFTDLLRKPNEFHTGKQFWKLWQKYFDITGKAFILKESDGELFANKKITRLTLLRPDLVTINYNETNTAIKSFSYAAPKGVSATYKPEQIIYKFEPDPKFPTEGCPLLRAGIRAMETSRQLEEYHSNVLDNGGQVDGVFKFKINLTEDQLKRAKEGYMDNMAGAKKSGTPLFLGGDADYVRLGLNPAELSFLETKRMTIDDIAILTGVPRVLLGVSSQETFSNADAAVATFLRDTIKPLLINLTEALNWGLVPDNLELDFIDPTPEDREQKRKDIETANTVNALSTNEKRELLGFEPRKEKEADDILVPFSVSPLIGIGDPAPVPTPPADNSQKSKSFKHPLKDATKRKQWGEMQLKRLDSRQGKLLYAMRGYFDGQRDRLVEHLQDKKQFKKKDLFGEIFNRATEIRLAKDTVLPVLRALMIEAGHDTSELMGYDFGFTMTSTLEKWLDERGNVFSDEITDVTYRKLERQFSDSFEAGETRSDLISRIENTYEGFNDTRARTIARTEVHGAIQKANMESQRQAGSPIKIWVWAAGVNGGARPDHQAMDGEEVPINMPFSNGLSFPGDPGADPAETVNCECS